MQDTKQKIDIYHISGDTAQKDLTTFYEMNMGFDRLYSDRKDQIFLVF